MLRFAAIVFLLIALIAGVFGFGFVTSSFMEAAKIAFFVFLVLAGLSLFGSWYRRRTVWG